MKRKRETMKDFMHIGGILPKAMRSYRRESDSELVRVWQVWDEAVGAVIAENARPVAFKGRFLIVHATGSAWVQQLRFVKGEIIRKVNDHLGKELISDITFRVGAL